MWKYRWQCSQLFLGLGAGQRLSHYGIEWVLEVVGKEGWDKTGVMKNVTLLQKNIWQDPFPIKSLGEWGIEGIFPKLVKDIFKNKTNKTELELTSY